MKRPRVARERNEMYDERNRLSTGDVLFRQVGRVNLHFVCRFVGMQHGTSCRMHQPEKVGNRKQSDQETSLRETQRPQPTTSRRAGNR